MILLAGGDRTTQERDIRNARKLARETGLGRESLYKELSADGNPELATVLKVMRALGLRLHVAGAST